MNGNNQRLLALVAALGLGLVLGWMTSHGPGASAQPAKGSGGPRYTVTETDGTNLLVTDNQTNLFYFYTIDKDAQIGSELKLRGTLDLNQVGAPAIKPKKAGEKDKN
jgi:hypothetical protein